MKLSNILVAVAVVGLLVTVFVHFVGEAEKAGYTESNYDSSELQVLINSSDNLQNTTTKTKEQLMNLQGNPNVLDIFGALLTGGYNALKTLGGSYTTIYGITAASAEQMPTGEMTGAFTQTAGLVLLILIFFGVILAVLLNKSDRI